MNETYDKLNHWYGWNGGECPVHPKTTFDAISEDIRWSNAPAKSFDWKSFCGAFRIRKLHVEPKVIWVNEYKDTHFSYSKKDHAENSAGMSAIRVAVRYVEQPL